MSLYKSSAFYYTYSDFGNAGFFTMAEGRYNTPELAAKAIESGAVAVTVGSAITRLEVVTQWFINATKTAGERKCAR